MGRIRMAGFTLPPVQRLKAALFSMSGWQPRR